MTKTGPANRLLKEKSPYLLQHAHNPVDWHPWGPEAFEKAKKEDKLIFLSIGYSTCHWCHVMEHESFENKEIAVLLNENFISIKVDREERPDIDQIYMSAVQALTGSGGWPLTVFLTPDGKPVTGGTYFPPEDRWGRPGMITILPRLAKAWKEERHEMQQAGDQIAELLQPQSVTTPETLSYENLFDTAYRQLQNSFDPEHGGFGSAPKFPRSHELSFLLRIWKRRGDSQALEIVEKTLQAMACGGIYDHLGGGFHRYSTDEKWLVPHFEKMLYDQAILARTYLEAYQATRREFYAAVARDIFRYVLRDMTAPEGGFYSAEDADSEGEEGKFYVWRPEEIEKILGREEAKLFNEAYGVTNEGNFEHATSILHIRHCEETAGRSNRILSNKTAITSPASQARNDNALDKLFTAREKRIHPHKDDKILTAWNGMMISALAYGAQVLNEPEYAEHAARAVEFVLKHLQKNARLLRRYREKESAVPGFQDDYAFFVLALLDLYETTFEARWLEEARRLADEMIRLFWDEKSGGFFYTASDAEPLVARAKEYYDGAVPSGNSVAALAMIRLSKMTADAALEQKVERLAHSNAASLKQHPAAYPQLLLALDFAAGPWREIRLTGKRQSEKFRELLQIVYDYFEPRRVLIFHSESPEVSVSICQNQTCGLPLTNAEDLKKALAEK